MLQTYPSLAHFDGRGANRPWLQELPDPITQVVWDTWVELNPKDAAKLGIATGDRVRVRSAHGEVETPAYVYPGIQPGAVAMPLGQGHTAFGRYATGAGVNAATLVAITGAACPWNSLVVRKARDLVVIPGHDVQEGRAIARAFTGKAHTEKHPEISLYPPHEHTTVPLGHGGRSRCLQRVQRLCHRLLCREQHPGSRKRGSAARAPHVLDSRGALLRPRSAPSGTAPHRPRADDVPAVRQGALRAGLPRVRRRTTPRKG